MSYLVDNDALQKLEQSITGKSGEWIASLNEIKTAVSALIDSKKMVGAGADNIKSYLDMIHILTIASLQLLIQRHFQNCKLYKLDYRTNIDTGTHFVIDEEELEDYQQRLTDTNKKAVSIDSDLSYVLGGIKEIFTVSYTNASLVDEWQKKTIRQMSQLDEDIKTLEKTHKDQDFVETEAMIQSLKTFIEERLACARKTQCEFTIDQLNTPAWIELTQQVKVLLQEDKEREKLLEEAAELEEEYLQILEEEKEAREWAKWLAVGVGIVASVALVVVTAGAAGPGVCAVVGAIGGAVSAGATVLADTYVENGSLEELDWSELGKECLIGAATGAVSGYLGAVSVGSAIQQPAQKAAFEFAKSAAENIAEGMVDIVWDVGEGLITGKPGDEILSVLEENTGEMLKEILVEGAGKAAGGYVSGHFDVDAGDKSFLQQLGADTAENAAEAIASNATEFVVDVTTEYGNALVDPESSKSFTTILAEQGKEALAETAKDFVTAEVEDVVVGAVDSYQSNHEDQSKIAEVVQDVAADTVGKSGGTFVGAAAGQGVEILTDSRENFSVKEIWEEDMDGGRKILQDAGKSAGQHVVDAVNEDKEFEEKMRRKDYDNDGKVEVVVFDKYMVTKEDYDAAREVAGKGAYKDKTAQDILGLPKNTPISEGRVEVKEVEISKIAESTHEGRKETVATKIDYKNENKKLYNKKKKK